ncbi:DUF7146 domain-containing protein [Vibrio penaeicida]|uniref:DUF7146 domain-containing protein n=1 Tax=Vibrio penaeicida TaxID=104609 RepID=UPI001CC81B49|nr:hypothetical protein [Vibrio penaeicida]
MSYVDYAKSVTDLARGKWPSILKEIVDPCYHRDILEPNGVCPNCGKPDLYMVPKKEADHALKCRKCDTSLFNGVRVADAFSQLKGRKLLKKIEELASKYDVSVEQQAVPVERDFARKEFDYISDNAIKIFDDRSALGLRYLSDRGIDVNNRNVINAMHETTYFVPRVSFYDKTDGVITKGEFPVLAFKVFNENGQHINWWKIYLDPVQGKAKVPQAKRGCPTLTKGQMAEEGYCIPFGRYDETVGVAEGPETALALIELGRNVFSTLTANGINRFEPPKCCKRFELYGDYDRSGTGQKVVVTKHADLSIKRPKVDVDIYLPPERLYVDGAKSLDFLDLLDGHKRGQFTVHEFEQCGFEI